MLSSTKSYSTNQLLTTPNQRRMILNPAEESPNVPPSQIIPTNVKPLKSIELPATSRIVSFDDSDYDSLSPPPETREATPTTPNNPMVKDLMSNMKWSVPDSNSRTRGGGRLDSKISKVMMIEPGQKTYKIALNADDSEQWKKAICKDMASMESYGDSIIVQKVPSGAAMIESEWIMGKKLFANGQIDKWKVRLVCRGDLQKPGYYNQITSPVIDSASIRLALRLAAGYDLDIAILDIPMAFFHCPLHEILHMGHLEGELLDPYGRAHPIV